MRRVFGIDPDALTQSEFDDYCELAPLAIAWESGKDVAGDLDRRRLEWQSLLMAHFGDQVPETPDDEDELSG